jgi:kinesin family member C1
VSFIQVFYARGGVEDTIANCPVLDLESEKSRAELTSANQTLRLELDGVRDRLNASLSEASTQNALHKQEVEHLHRINEDLRSHISTATSNATNMESAIERLQDRITELESENKSQSIQYAVLKEQMHAAVTRISEANDKVLEDRKRREELLQAKIDELERERKCESERYAAMAKDKDSALKEANETKERLFREELARSQALQAKVEFLESDSKSQSEHYAAMAKDREAAIATAIEATEKLRKEETLRRKLHNTIQELKGNIRVFCRVRPGPSSNGSPCEEAQITFPDVDNSTQIEVRGPDEKNSLGKDITKTHPFAFDRVFSPTSSNQEVFDEISQLIQSALDGYNVCIFAYGQTGAGKTYTMSAEDGMIPRALRMIYNNTKDLEDRGWRYTMTGSFVEVYNENLNDLLGKSEDMEKKKLEIKHDMQNSETTITNVTIVNLDSTDEVESILARAMAKRSVAATQANERSSRSHSVFMLTVVGQNTITGENSKGTLNLVDLAGSERLNQSKAEGARLKETQSINRSLSSLGDVIGALAQGKDGGHVPYRNSKLTNLLQFSLGGNSKTLMFCMVSPLKDHLSESLTTLRFAAKVNSTHIGRASKA